MDVNKVAAVMAGMADSLRVIESAMELTGQTSRLQNILNRTHLQEVAGNAVVALQRLNIELKGELTNEEADE